ncbi:hypothetical protein Purlil1_6857 [Purpureocillium lilacinum]|uniref:Uncharacterized protein n=1 Tax=Purpureocillium lilacinum TaxID=33203 RepID=A0ABR0BX38_PURLI|nr:hypothetical protein Purlil1_6857 [Purpureocillium lilacinum]
MTLNNWGMGLAMALAVAILALMAAPAGPSMDVVIPTQYEGGVHGPRTKRLSAGPVLGPCVKYPEKQEQSRETTALFPVSTAHRTAAPPPPPPLLFCPGEFAPPIPRQGHTHGKTPKANPLPLSYPRCPNGTRTKNPGDDPAFVFANRAGIQTQLQLQTQTQARPKQNAGNPAPCRAVPRRPSPEKHWLHVPSRPLLTSGSQ